MFARVCIKYGGTVFRKLFVERMMFDLSKATYDDQLDDRVGCGEDV